MSTKQNSLNTTDEISTDNLDQNFGPTGPLKKIVKKAIHVCGRSTWRGTPSKLTSKDKIGEDGKEPKYAMQIAEEFEVLLKDEKINVSSFYITGLMYNQLDNLVPDDTSIDMLFKEGKKTGTLYVVKRKNSKPNGMDYWSFVNEKQLKEVETV